MIIEREAGNILDPIMNHSILVRKRRVHWEDIIFHCDANCARDGSVQTKCLAHNRVKIRERHEFVHGRSLGLHCQEFLPELGLNVRA